MPNLSVRRVLEHVFVIELRRCGGCGARKPPEEFNWRRGPRGDPIVLEFDRIGDDKRFSIDAKLVHHSWQAILEEIAKCEVVCANCHRRRTARRRGSRRWSVGRGPRGADDRA